MTLIYKTDVARACVNILTNKKVKKSEKSETEIFNLAAEPISMREFVGEIAKHLDKTIPKIELPPRLLNIIFEVNAKLFRLKKVNKISDTVEKWLSDDIYSAKKIEKVYGFQPKFSIAEAIKRQVKWYKSESRKKLRQK